MLCELMWGDLLELMLLWSVVSFDELHEFLLRTSHFMWLLVVRRLLIL